MPAKGFSFNADEARNIPVYHGSNTVDPEEFLKAPLLHVGTQDQANQIIEQPETYLETYEYSEDQPHEPRWPIGTSFPGVHKLQFSQFAEFYPKVMGDTAVNVAHGLLLKKNRMDPEAAIMPGNWKELQDRADVQEALKALEENKVVPYHNKFETPVTSKGEPIKRGKISDSAFISYAVPSPHLNLRLYGNAEPVTQPVLPMDYSGESNTSRSRSARERFNKRGIK